MPPESQPSEQSAKRYMAAVLGLGATVVLGAFALIRSGVAPGWVRMLDNVHWTAAFTTSAIMAWLGVGSAGPDVRSARRWFALGVTAYAFGQVLWDIQVANGWIVFPAPSDIFYPFLGLGSCAGFWWSLRAMSAPEQRENALRDCGALVVAVLTLVLALYLPRQGALGLLPMFFLVAYPVVLLGAVCLGVVLVLTLRLSLASGWPLLTLCLLGDGVMWMEWNRRALDNTLDDGSWFNFGFSILALLLGVGVARWRPVLSTSVSWERACENTLRLLPLVLVLVVAASLLLVMTIPGVPGMVQQTTVFGCLIVVCLASLRQSLLLAERDQLLVAEQQLRENESRFRVMFDSNLQGVFFTDTRGAVSQANDAFLRMIGHTREDLDAGRISWKDMTPPEHVANDERAVRELAATGVCQPWEKEYIRKDGTRIPVIVGAAFVEAGQDKAIAFAIDITARKQVEAALGASENNFRLLVEQAADGIFIADRAGRLIEANLSGGAMLGYAREEILRLSIPDVHPPEEAARVAASMPRLMAGETVHAEYLFKRKDGSTFPGQLSGKLLSDGRLQGIVRDITERKQSELARERVHSLVQATLESTADGILVVDREGRIETSNRLFARMWRIPGEVLATGDDARVMQCVLDQLRDPPQFTAKVAHLYAHPEEESFDRVEFKDGRVFERYSRPQLIGGQVVGRVWSFRDITEQRRLEEQLRQSQKMEAIGQLSGGIAHDFNNLLTAIIGHLDLLRDNPQVTPQIAESLGEISAAANRAASLTGQLLAFSRRQVITTTVLDLNEVVKHLGKMLRRVLGEQVAVQLDFAPEPLTFQGDAGMMEQVLVNLAVNARDAMPQGGTLRIITRRETRVPPAQDGTPATAPVELVRLSVADTGTGIPPEIRSKIFEPFFTTKGVGKGTGLGLATVFGIMQQHHGWIEMESDVGRGTSFHLYLPLLARPPATGPVAEPAQPARGRGELILLVEDEAAVQQVVTRALGRYGYRVLLAGNGPEALKVWAAHKAEIALLLTDLIMPEGISGLQLARLLLEENPGLRVVYTSGYSAEIAGREIKLTDGVNYLGKPYELDRLFRTVRAALDRKQSRSPF